MGGQNFYKLEDSITIKQTKEDEMGGAPRSLGRKRNAKFGWRK
jgi:hypothetical protein